MKSILLLILATSTWAAQVDPRLLTKLQNGPTNIFIEFTPTKPVLDLVNSLKFSTHGEKITFMKEKLEELALQSQTQVLSKLTSHSGRTRSFWISNSLFVQDATIEIVNSIADFSEVTKIYEEFKGRVNGVVVKDAEVLAEWGVDKIEAEQAWQLPGGNNGGGVIISTTDTGVRYTHETLVGKWRQDYGWYDPYTGGATPIDENGHGTHTMGTLVGSSGIGVAPGATYISCRACDTIECTGEALMACGEWTTCPTRPDGSGADCSKAPQISSNSWYFFENGDWYIPVVDAWHAAGIIPIFCNGNSGPGCGTVTSPADQTNAIGVGSTNSGDVISSYSSRGPSRFNGVKPDISAPGESVRSAYFRSDTDYAVMSGTSMATPHVAGVATLLLSRNPNLTYQQVKDLIHNNADRSLGNAATCGGTPPDTFPNNIYGYGRVNARRALAAAIG